MRIDNQTESKIINALRFPLIAIVVFIHLQPMHSLRDMVLDNEGFNISYYIIEVLSHTIGQLAVPLFFIFSGYYMFKKEKEWLQSAVYLREMKKKAKTLLLPYILWNLSYLLLQIARVKLLNDTGTPTEGLDLSLPKLFQDLWLKPIDYPLWYIRDLIYLNLLAPLIYFLCKKFRFLPMLIVLGIFLAVPFPNLLVTGVLFFTIGSTFSINKVSLLDFAHKYRVALLIFGFLSTFGLPFFYGNYWTNNYLKLYQAIGVFSILAFASLFYQKAKAFPRGAKILKTCIDVLQPTAFFVYALHAVFIINWASVLGHKLTDIDLLAYFISGGGTIIFAVLSFYILKKLTPRFLAYYVGGRL